MSQHDYNIANQGFPNFRSDLNNALGAIATNNSGSTAPTTTFAHQWWLDTSTTPNTLRIRNADNDAWVVVGTVNQTDDTFVFTPAAGSASAPAYSVTGDTNTGIFFPAADTIAFAEGGAEAMRIDSSGNVGIGTTAPSYPLEVLKNQAATTSISVDNNTGNAASHASLRLHTGGASSGDPFVYFYNEITDWSIGCDNSDSDKFKISKSSTLGTNDYFNIDSSGNVGIGTSSPTDGDGYGRALDIRSATGAAIYLRDSDDTTNDTLIVGRDSSNSYIDSKSGNLIIYNAGSERARITSGGQMSLISTADGLHVGSTQASGTSYWLYRGASAATAGTANSGTDRFFVFTNGNVTNSNGSYGTISDAKLKQDIIDAGSQWADIKNLRFRKYRMKSDVAENPNAPYLLGFVAQELETISPGLIEEHPDTTLETKTREVEKTREIPAVLDEDGNEVEPARTETYTETEKYTEIVDLGTTTKSIKTSILYMKAVKALQEAMTRIEALEAQNAAFEARLAALEAK